MFTFGGAGNNNSIFSSKVMLLVSLGSNLFKPAAVVGGAGNGGSVVGLPGLPPKMLFREGVRLDPDLLLRCPGLG